MRYRIVSRIIVAVAAIVLGFPRAPAAAIDLPSETDRWIQIRTAHFTF